MNVQAIPGKCQTPVHHSVLPRRVIKLGGSLLDWPDWPRAFRDWQRTLPPAADWIVVGGGQPVDRLRRLDARADIGQLGCHHIAMEFTTVNAHRVAHQLGFAVVVDCTDAIEASQEASCVVVDVVGFDRRCPLAHPHRNERLAENWDVTSDTLAAAVAHRIRADHLILLKSSDAPAAESWSHDGFVDPAFAEAIPKNLSVNAVNLRAYKQGRPSLKDV